jgi:hypothetical protein
MGSGESSIRVLEVSDDVFPGSLSYRLVEETGISVPRGAGVGARVFRSEHEARAVAVREGRV